MNYKLQRALESYPKLEKSFLNFISNPEEKLNLNTGIIVLPSDALKLKIEVFGKQIELRFNIVFLDDKSTLGQITAFFVKTYDGDFVSEDPIFVSWFDRLGNIRIKTPDNYSNYHLEAEGALLSFVNMILSDFIDSKDFLPAN